MKKKKGNRKTEVTLSCHWFIALSSKWSFSVTTTLWKSSTTVHQLWFPWWWWSNNLLLPFNNIQSLQQSCQSLWKMWIQHFNSNKGLEAKCILVYIFIYVALKLEINECKDRYGVYISNAFTCHVGMCDFWVPGYLCMWYIYLAFMSLLCSRYVYMFLSVCIIHMATSMHLHLCSCIWLNH